MSEKLIVGKLTWWIYFSLFIFSFSLFTSCSPERRLHRLIKKFPQLSKIDTLKIQDTTVIPEISIDTFFQSKSLTDTFEFSKEKLNIRLFQINDTIYLDANVKADTVIITKEIPIEKIIHVKPKSVFERLFYDKKNCTITVLLIIAFLIIIYFVYSKSKFS